MVVNRERTIRDRREEGKNIKRQPVEDRIVPNRESKSARSGQLEEPVAAGLALARKAWDEYQASAKYDRNAVYIYLQVVFDVVQDWKKMGMADSYSLKALKRQEFAIRMNPDPYARLIYCSTEEDDPKKRSKWAKVMQWVANQNRNGESFTKFVKRHGGLNECADSDSLDR